MKSLRWFLPLAIFLVVVGFLFAGLNLNPREVPSPLIGKRMPAFSLPVLGEPQKQISDKDLLGKPFLLNVWGSWCPACREEQPQLARLSQMGRVRIIGYDYKDEAGEAAKWLQEFGNPFEFVIADEEGRVALDWGVYGAPETFLVDAKGIVRWKTVGPISDVLLQDELLPKLAELEKQP